MTYATLQQGGLLFPGRVLFKTVTFFADNGATSHSVKGTYRHVVLDDLFAGAHQVNEIGPKQFPCCFTLERRHRVVEADIEGVTLWLDRDIRVNGFALFAVACDCAGGGCSNSFWSLPDTYEPQKMFIPAKILEKLVLERMPVESLIATRCAVETDFPRGWCCA